MKKNQVIEQVEIQDVAAEGKCLTRYQERVIFVAGNQVAPGDVVDLKIIRKRKSYLEGTPIRFHSYAKQRIEPFCAHFGTCGGCKWQHIPYANQLRYKQQQVMDNLQRIAKVDLPEIQPILGSEKTRYYRNKLEFTFSNQRWFTTEEMQIRKAQDPAELDPQDELALGFHIPGRFDKILDIEHCYLQPDPSNAIRLATKKYALEKKLEFFDLREQVGLLRNIVIRNSNLGDWMVMVIFFKEEPDAIEGLLRHLQKSFPQITSLHYLINPKKNDAYQDLEPVLFAGKPYIEEEMEGLRFRIGAKSFFQTNSHQALVLYQIARDFADLQGHELVYDLYTGTGTIANFIARQARHVIGLEYVPEAIEDAKVNAQINQIENTEFYAGDIKDLLDESFIQTHGRPDVIITDPPRAGMHPDVVEMMRRTGAHKIIYVSCNPATQARDLALLDVDYRVTAVQPVDMFPQTHHVENVVKLVRREDRG